MRRVSTSSPRVERTPRTYRLLTVGMVVGQVGAGHRVEEIPTDYPYLEREDVMQAIRYAARRAEEREVILLNA